MTADRRQATADRRPRTAEDRPQTTAGRPRTADDQRHLAVGGRPSAVKSSAVSFLGDWLVSEYVYTPAGEYVGVVQQRRRLQPLSAEKIRVIQICERVETAVNISPQAEQVAALMNQRVGEFVFDLQLAGRARHYLGPDVIGGGFSWLEGALTARGLWPRFGYNFTSFSILLNPERQVTGGKFFVANEEVATIVGAAVPEAQGMPELTADGRPPTAFDYGDYRGRRYFIAPDGELVETAGIEGYGRIAQEINDAPGREKWYGPLREVETVTGPGETLSLLEVHDQGSAAVAGLGRRIRDEKLCGVELYILTADHGKPTADRRRPTAKGANLTADRRRPTAESANLTVGGQRNYP